jgi:hypothetical protein
MRTNYYILIDNSLKYINSTLMYTLINLINYLLDNQEHFLHVSEYQSKNTLNYFTIYIAIKSLKYFLSISQAVTKNAAKPLNVFSPFIIIT